MVQRVARIRHVVLRDALWLNADRAVAFSRVLLLVWLGLTVSVPWTVPGLRIGVDFAAFWTAGRLALDGQAADAYGDAGRQAMAALLGGTKYAPFFYPPTGLLLWVPFALLPFAAATAIWIAGTTAAYTVAIRVVLKARSYVAALAFPGAVIAAFFGQNAMLSAALFGGAAATLERSPLLAGVFIGCLAYKPQLAVLAPLALIVAGRWRAFFAATVTVAILVAASATAFGRDAWSGFIVSLAGATAWNANGAPGFNKFSSPYAAIRLLGGSATTAWVVQGVLAALAIVVLIAVLRRRPGGAGEIAMLVVATGFCVPFLGIYDVVLFMVAGAWLVSEANRTAWLSYERVTLVLLFLSPIAILVLMTRGIPLAPVALAILAGLVIRRVFRPVSVPASVRG